MELWRQRVGDCIGFDWDKSVQSSPPTIVVIDRQWNASRHIINVNHVMATLKLHYPTARVELHYLEGLNLKQQALIYNRASIVLWVHGASMANLIFLPRRAVGLHIVPRPHVQENLDWPEELVRDLSHEVIPLPYFSPLCLPLLVCVTLAVLAMLRSRMATQDHLLPVWSSLACLGTVVVKHHGMYCTYTLQVDTAIAIAKLWHCIHVKWLFKHGFGLAPPLLIALLA